MKFSSDALWNVGTNQSTNYPTIVRQVVMRQLPSKWVWEWVEVRATIRMLPDETVTSSKVSLNVEGDPVRLTGC